MSRSERERAGPSSRAVLGLVAAMAVAIALSAIITLSRSPASGTASTPMPSTTLSRLTSAANRPVEPYLSFTIDPAPFRVLDLGLSKHAPVIPLSAFGPVTRLV